MNKLFRFTYEFLKGEIPDECYIRANNITNAKLEYEKSKYDSNSRLIQIAVAEKNTNGWKVLFETKHGWSL